jgi:MYXO-CTERM domain-containing protein
VLACLFALLPITGGAVDPGDDAVVYAADDRQTCTGTMITPYVVVTAAHCLVDGYRGLSVVVGPDASGAPIGVVDGLVHPLWDATSGANDVGVLFLAAPVTAPPLPVPTGALDAELPGAIVRLVGYGETAGGAGDDGIKRTGTAMVIAVRAGEIDLGPGPSLACVGDSGGPVLLDVGGVETLVGVVSRGDGACAVMTTAIRLDVHLADFIDPYVAATAPGSAADWERCLHAEQCATGVCVTARDEPLITYCAPTCAGDAGCPDGTECAPSAAGDACQYVLPTPGAFGAACAGDAACVSGMCAAPAGETDEVCSVRCVPGLDQCPVDTTCERVVGSEHGCFAPAGGCGCRAGGRDLPGAAVLVALVALALTRDRRRSGTRGSATRRETR